MERQGGHVRTKRNLIRTSVEEVGSARPGRGNELIGFLTGGVVPVGVGIVVEEVLGHGGCHVVRNLGAAGAIEVGDRMSAVAPFESGEARADDFDGGHLADGLRGAHRGLLAMRMA